MKFDAFLREVCPPLNLHWRKYRHRSARHRVDTRLKELSLRGYDNYLERVRTDPREAALLPDLMRVTVSRFFREKKAWDELREPILPGLVTESGSTGTVRAWSAGCCGGEEPFSLALLWLQCMAPIYPQNRLQIIATDIDPDSLERARTAVYRSESLRELPAEIRDRWFARMGHQWRLGEEPRSLVDFRQSNLLTDQPPQGMDLVLCRYLPFTYYCGERLGAAAQKLWDSLRPGGILMIGAKEALDSPALEYFQPLRGTAFFYRRRE